MIRKALLSIPLMSVLAVMLAAGIVYAAVSGSATGGGAVTQFTTNTGDCRNITNNNAQALFVPANTTGEWNAFLNNAPNKAVSSCCVAQAGQACSSAANSCGQTNAGTIQCNGTCSAGVPANPAGYGNACSSSPNSCGTTNSGTIQCNGTCSASTPANPADVYQCGAPYCVTEDSYCGSYSWVCDYDSSGNLVNCEQVCDDWVYYCTGWAQDCQWVSGC